MGHAAAEGFACVCRVWIDKGATMSMKSLGGVGEGWSCSRSRRRKRKGRGGC